MEPGLSFEERLTPIVMAELCQLLTVIAHEKREIEEAVLAQVVADNQQTFGAWA